MSRIYRFAALTPVLALAVLASCDGPSRELPTGAASLPEDGAGGIAPLVAPAEGVIPDRYLVVLKPQVTSVAAAARQMVPAAAGKLHFSYQHAIKGFAATLTPEAVESVRRNPQVQYVARDAWMEPSATQTGATWGLDRIDQRGRPLNTTYVYGPTGAGVRVYVIDTGIRPTHAEFGTRASIGTDFIADGRNGVDCNGHGTHVAGTIAGTTYGVAKAARVIAVRVFGCSGGTPTTTIIAAVDWVTANAQKPAVVNMSLGGPVYAPLNQAVQNSVAAGLVYVVAAGNENTDACQRSPASTPQAITVGATTSSDARSSFSNWGTCVDLFAPGSSITSAWWQSDTQIHTIDGTSMASPHVAGVAALVLQGTPTATPAAVAQKVLTTTSQGRLTGLGTGSPNLLLFSGLTVEPPAPRIAVNPAAISLTYVRHVAAAPPPPQTAAGEAPAAPRFTAAGEGAAKTDAADDGTVHAAALDPSVLSGRVLLTNPGIGALEWTAASNQPWLAVNPGGGSLSPTFGAVLTATATPGTRAPGTYAAAITLSAPGAVNTPVQIPVTLAVTDARTVAPGAPRTGLAGAAGTRAYFVVTVPTTAAQLTITTSGGTGDADLHVRYGNLPSTTQYDCRPFTGSNNETCQVAFPAPGTYYVMLHAYSAYSGVTLAASFGGPPEAPSNLRATGITATAVILAWTDGSVSETSFTLSRSTMSGAGTFGAWTNVASPAANATTFSNTGVATGTTYRYRLRACNTAGCSAWVTMPNVTTPGVAPPTGVTAAAVSGSSIRLNWTDASRNETVFNVQRRLRETDGVTWGAWAAAANPAAGSVTYTSTGLLGGRAYQFQVRACNGATCSAWVPSAIVTVPVPPAAPTGVTGTVLSGTAIRVNWTDGSGNETSFNVQRRQRNPDGTYTAFVDVANPAANATTVTNTGLTAGTTYQYRVRACNLAGCSVPGASPFITIPTAPAPPSNAAATVLSATSVRVTWTDGSTNEASFTLQRRLLGTDGVTWGAWTTAAAPAANATTFTHTGLAASRTYQFQVRACNVGGCSAFAVTGNVTTPAS